MIPPAAVSEETATTQVVLAFEDNKLASLLFGQYGQNLALIERRLGVVADQRGNHVTLEGSRGGCEQARRVLEGLYERIKPNVPSLAAVTLFETCDARCIYRG